jgi:hypothetical protein
MQPRVAPPEDIEQRPQPFGLLVLAVIEICQLDQYEAFL